MSKCDAEPSVADIEPAEANVDPQGYGAALASDDEAFLHLLGLRECRSTNTTKSRANSSFRSNWDPDCGTAVPRRKCASLTVTLPCSSPGCDRPDVESRTPLSQIWETHTRPTLLCSAPPGFGTAMTPSSKPPKELPPCRPSRGHGLDGAPAPEAAAPGGGGSNAHGGDLFFG